ECRMKRGRGYVSADKNFDEDLGIGWIPIDSVHSPIKKVNYPVEAARLGQTTDYDKLTVDVWPNGSVAARDAAPSAAKPIRDHLRHEDLTKTVTKAKELRPFVERIITIAKRGLAAAEPNGRTLNARRLVMHDLQDHDVVAKLFDTLAPRFAERAGGYTRLLRI